MKNNFGKLLGYEVNDCEIKVSFEKKDAYFTVVCDEIVRVYVPFFDENCKSKAIEENPCVDADFTVEQDGKAIVISTEKVVVKIYDDFVVDFYNEKGKLLMADYRGERTIKEKVSWMSLEMLEAEGHDISGYLEKQCRYQLVKKLDDGDDFYGLGDKSGFLNKKHYEYENWNSDLPQAHNEDFKALYKSIPFLMCLKAQGEAYGVFFDNTFRSNINLGKENTDYFFYTAEEGNLDYYFMVGEDLVDVVGSYTYLTGTTPLPQLFTLGYQQSRWGYESADDINFVVDNYRASNIPLDVIHLDIDYMDNFKVFTWNEKNYGKPGELFDRIKGLGVKPVCIIDPGTKVEKGYSIDDEGVANDYFAKDKDGEVYVNAVWPGDSHFPDFGKKEVRDWWANNHKVLTDLGVGGIWNDMNEPASFHGELPTDVVFHDEERVTNHAEIHNVYGHNMCRATFQGLQEQTGKRPFVITRACYAGSQKYATVWTGDNQSLWHHLQMVIPQLCNLGMSGFAFCGTDIGGFGADCTPELLCRWIQAAMFSPLFRNHAAKGTKDQEPWRFGKEVVDINRKYIELRYKFLPYIYDLFYKGEKTGLPVMRPLVLHYPNDPEVRNMNNEFLAGENILVAPVLEQGATKRMVYLPEGTWYDFWTGEKFEGKQYILKDAPMDVCPMYIKAGSIIPTYEVVQYVGEKPYNKLTLLVTPGEGSYEHFQDNGEDYAYKNGIYNLYQFTTDVEGNLNTEMLHQEYPVYKGVTVEKLGF